MPISLLRLTLAEYLVTHPVPTSITQAGNRDDEEEDIVAGALDALVQVVPVYQSGLVVLCGAAAAVADVASAVSAAAACCI